MRPTEWCPRFWPSTPQKPRRQNQPGVCLNGCGAQMKKLILSWINHFRHLVQKIQKQERNTSRVFFSLKERIRTSRCLHSLLLFEQCALLEELPRLFTGRLEIGKSFKPDTWWVNYGRAHCVTIYSLFWKGMIILRHYHSTWFRIRTITRLLSAFVFSSLQWRNLD